MNVTLAPTPTFTIHNVKNVFLETQPPDEYRYTCTTLRLRCDYSGDSTYAELSLFSEHVDNQLDAMEQLRDALTKNIDAHIKWRTDGQFERLGDSSGVQH